MENFSFAEQTFSIVYGYVVLMAMTGYFTWEFEKTFWADYESQ